MSDVAPLAAAEYLRELLLKPGPYRESWHRHVVRPRKDVINQLAVAEAIAAHQPSGHGRGGESPMLTYQLREVVSGALFGGQLNTETLELFIAAFRFSEDDAGRLRRLLAGSSRINVMSGTSAVPVIAAHEVDAAIGRRKHQTLSLHDHVWLTADGRIDRVRTMQVIEAIAPAVDRIPILCDTNVLTLEVGQGCKELAGPVRRIGADVFATDILLARTLDTGETLTLEYWHSYRYSGDRGDRVEQQYRRGVLRRADNLDMRVEFHPDKLPARVWWAHWDGADDTIVDEEEVTLDIQHSAHRYVRSIEKTVVGFYWQWADPL